MKCQFRNSQVIMQPVDGHPHQYRILRPLVFITSEGDAIRVPPGFVTDLASVPRFFWRILPPFGRYTAASVVHDYLCVTAADSVRVTYEYADRIFLEAMEALHVPRWKRWVMYRAVRLAHVFDT